MRTVSFEVGVMKHPAGSCRVRFGDTEVLCSASVESNVPPFLVGTGKGWITAEYAMLPGSTPGGRKRREIAKPDGRSTEIQRLIGRSLRAAVDMARLGEISIVVDCDVIQADGGTRTASISGGWVALYQALTAVVAKKRVEDDAYPSVDELLTGQVAAVSVGIVDGEIVCDLDYAHDSRAEVDMNIVKLGDRYVEVQGTGEHGTFGPTELASLLAAADAGLAVVFAAQREAIGAIVTAGKSGGGR
jgi:ribonuclease PH